MRTTDILKSDIGAQAAWKGFTSQTMYIANRLISDNDGYEYYPEDVEDLIIRNNGVVVEAVQIKNISSDLSISSLSSAKTSQNGDGLFKRMCSLHKQFPSFEKITVAFFGSIGTELKELGEKKETAIEAVKNKLVKNHGLSAEEADWIINSLSFEKVFLPDLKKSIQAQIVSYVPVMPAPHLAEELLIHYISQLSNNKGFTTKEIWENQIHNIGVSISAIDGFYKEYNKSLVCLSELQLNLDEDEIKKEYSQGVSAHPAHIRLDLDLARPYWTRRIQETIDNERVAVVKGVSGQGKSTLCYRYLIDNYPEGCVFCVRAIASEEQAQNLVTALDGLGKHNKNLIIYIDVMPGETLWAFLLQELQSRGMTIPVLVSIRDEDYNATPVNGKSIKYGVIELALAEDEAHQIFDSHTADRPNQTLRSFDEAWQSFGSHGPLIEFIYLLTNEQTLKDRVKKQIDALIREKIDDEWIDVLRIVAYAGRIGCPVDYAEIKRSTKCSNMEAAISRLKDEYLIRVIDNGKKIEALHPVRAQIIYDTLRSLTASSDKDIFFDVLSCVSSRNIRLILLDYFTRNRFDSDDIQRLAEVPFADWLGYANAIKSMLWLDCKCYAENNLDYICSLVDKYGSGWLCFLPMDLSGLLQPNILIAESMKDLSIINADELQNAIDKAKQSLTSTSLDYKLTDCFLKNSNYPQSLPFDDEQRSSFGYSLFWMAKRGIKVELPYDDSEIVRIICNGGLQPSADAIRGLFEHPNLAKSYLESTKKLTHKIISEMRVIFFAVSDENVTCKFIPPLENSTTDENTKYDNQYWRIKMLNILQQLYPDIEYIDIELVGVNLLDDLGIPVMDDKLHIHKSKRTTNWISETNGWVRVRIEYSMRPATWNLYVSQIDDIRKCIVQFSDTLIRLIDDIYKKGRYTKERWNSVKSNIEQLQKLTLPEKYLPICAVDPYCLYSESSAKSPLVEFVPIAQLLSAGKYEKFRKHYSDMCSSMSNFCNQFSEILLARINKKEIGTIKNPRLAIFNLFEATKALLPFQQEYNVLFSRYSSVDGAYDDHERESLLTLVNMWRYVLDYPPRGIAIAYDAKQRYRKGNNYFRNVLNAVSADENTAIYTTSNHVYIKKSFDVSEDSIEKKYTETVLQLREAFKDAIPYSSDRWYLETQPLELAFLPMFPGSCFPIAYSIPVYKLLDYEAEKIATSMFPCEIELEVTDGVENNFELIDWDTMYQSLGAMRLHLKRFYQVLQVSVDKECTSGMTAYIDDLLSQVSILWRDYAVNEDAIKKVEVEESETNFLLFDLIKASFACESEVMAIIAERRNPMDAIKTIESLCAAIFLVKANVMERN